MLQGASVDGSCAVLPTVETAGRIRLRDGSIVLVRPIDAGDGDLLLDGFSRLSVQSRRHRFLTAKHRLSPGEVRFFTDVDHHDHEAIVGIDAGDGRGVGVARYVRSQHDPQEAELALTVVDGWQRRGVGTALLTRLIARARRAGVEYFTALVSADNDAMVGLLRNAAGVKLTDVYDDTFEYQIALAPFAAGLRRPWP